jgi:catechol 2,3-dioxygenase-like lactoylglutathione lyase family enzyme
MKILEIELLSDDLAQTETFYKKVMGLQPYLKQGSKLFYSIGYSKLIFSKSHNVKPVYHFAVDIPNNRFKEALQTIKPLVNILPVQGNDIADFKNWDAHSFYFYDNNGNIVELITRYASRSYDNAAFSAASYISISEIGLVTPKVPDFADMLTLKFGIPVFHRQPRGEKFTAMGDDDGLFIIAESGREWFPVKDKAHAYSTRVIVMQDGAVHHFVK